MDNSSKEILVDCKKENIDNIENVNIIIKTEPVEAEDSIEADYVDSKNNLFTTINSEINIKTEKYENDAEMILNNKSWHESLNSPNLSESNFKIEFLSESEKEHVDPLDICTTQIEMGNVLDQSIQEGIIFKEILSTTVEKKSKSKRSGKKDRSEVSSKKIYNCDVCGKIFPQSSNLKRHILTHTGIKPFKCNICDETFGSKSHLQRHYLIHTGDKPFKCDICNQTFRQKNILDRHKLIHSDEKPYWCEHCDQQFRYTSDLVRHKRIHSSEKPYTCDFCGKAFRQMAHVNSHKLIHTNERPFQCEVCFKTFTQKSGLKRHMQQVHKI